MSSRPPRHFYTHWLAKTLGVLITATVVAATLWSAKYDRTVSLLSGVLSCFLLWITISYFRLHLTVDDEGIHKSGYLFRKPRTVPWNEVKVVRMFPLPDGWPVFIVAPPTKEDKGVSFGLEIAGYKQLLKEILLRVPADAEIHPDILQRTKFLDSFEGRQRLSEIRGQSGQSSS